MEDETDEQDKKTWDEKQKTKKCPRNRAAIFERASGDTVELEYDMLVGADGVNSRVRKSLEENVPDFTVRQREVRYVACWRAPSKEWLPSSLVICAVSVDARNVRGFPARRVHPLLRGPRCS